MLKPIKFTDFFLKKTCLFLTAVLFSNVVFAYTPEANFWKDRLASLPAAASFPNVPIGNPATLKTLDPRLQISGMTKPLNFLNSIPASFGTIRKISNSTKSSRTVIHIQDVHLNAEAQANIGKTVGALAGAKHVDLIALEGAFAPIDLGIFQEFPHHPTIQKVADIFLKLNKISGPLHAALTLSGSAPRIVGIDDRDHYDANVAAYQRSSSVAEKTKRQIAALEKRLSEEKAGVFNTKLAEFDARVQAYRYGRMSLGEYVEVLESSSRRKTGSSLPIETFLSAYKLEKNLNFSRVEAERSLLIADLTKALTKNESAELMDVTLSYRTGQIGHSDFYSYLRSLCSRKEVALSRFPAMRDYLQYVLLSDSVDAEKLFTGLRELEDTVFTAFIHSDRERELVDQSRHQYLVEKLVGFELTKEEWDEYKTLTSQEGDLLAFEQFYIEAEIRDRKMAENLAAAMQKYNAKTVVLVTGGFHSSGVQSSFRRGDGITVVSFVPKITKVEDASSTTALSIFTQEKTPLDKIFAGEKLFLAPSPMSPSVMREAAAVASAEALAKGLIPLAIVKPWLERATGWMNVRFEKITNAMVQIFGQETLPSGKIQVFGLSISVSNDEKTPWVTSLIQDRSLATWWGRIKSFFDRLQFPCAIVFIETAAGFSLPAGIRWEGFLRNEMSSASPARGDEAEPNLISKNSLLGILGQGIGVDFYVPQSARKNGYWQYELEVTEAERKILDEKIIPSYRKILKAAPTRLIVVFNGKNPMMLFSSGLTWNQLPEKVKDANHDKIPLGIMSRQDLSLGYALFPVFDAKGEKDLIRTAKWIETHTEAIGTYINNLFEVSAVKFDSPIVTFKGIYQPNTVSSWIFYDEIHPRPNSLVYVIGAGTGVDALMAAQRGGPSVHVVATDIQPLAIVNMAYNVAQSRYANQIEIVQADLLDIPGRPTEEKATHIYWNMPLPETDSDDLNVSDPNNVLLDRLLKTAPSRLVEGGTLEVNYTETPDFFERVYRHGWEPAYISGTETSRNKLSPHGSDYSRIILVRQQDPLARLSELREVHAAWAELADLQIRESSGGIEPAELVAGLSKIERRFLTDASFSGSLLVKVARQWSGWIRFRKNTNLISDIRSNSRYQDLLALQPGLLKEESARDLLKIEPNSFPGIFFDVFGLSVQIPLSAVREGFWEWKVPASASTLEKLKSLGVENSAKNSDPSFFHELTLLFLGEKPLLIVDTGLTRGDIKAEIEHEIPPDMPVAAGVVIYSADISQANDIGSDLADYWFSEHPDRRILLWGPVARHNMSLGDVRLLALPETFNGSDITSSVALSGIDPKPNAKVLDLASGSGILGLTAALRGAAHVVLSDFSQSAFLSASINVRLAGLESKVEVVQGNLFEKLQGRKFDHIYANPPMPYQLVDDPVLNDPELKFLRKFLMGAADHLEEGGTVEIAYLESSRFISMVYETGWDISAIQGSNIAKREQGEMDVDLSRFVLIRRPPGVKDALFDQLRSDWKRLASLEYEVLGLNKPRIGHLQTLGAVRQKYAAGKSFNEALILKSANQFINYFSRKKDNPPLPEVRNNEKYQSAYAGSPTALNSNRPAQIDFDLGFMGLIEKDNPGTKARIEKIITTSFSKLKAGEDYDLLSGERSVIFILKNPILYRGRKYGRIKVKGVVFNSDKPMKRYSILEAYREAGLLVPERVEEMWVSDVSFSPLGHFVENAQPFIPFGGMWFRNAVNELEMSRSFLKAGVNVGLPLASAEFKGIKTPDGDSLGVVVLGLPWDDLVSAGDYLMVLARRYQKFIKAHAESSARSPEYDTFEREVIRVVKTQGKVLRTLHDHGMAHFQFHLGNWSIQPDGNIFVHDLEGAKLEKDLTPAQYLGYRLYGIKNSLQNIIGNLNSPGSAFAATKLDLTIPFLKGYFGNIDLTLLRRVLNAYGLGIIFHAAKDVPIQNINHPIVDLLKSFKSVSSDRPSSIFYHLTGSGKWGLILLPLEAIGLAWIARTYDPLAITAIYAGYAALHVALEQFGPMANRVRGSPLGRSPLVSFLIHSSIFALYQFSPYFIPSLVLPFFLAFLVHFAFDAAVLTVERASLVSPLVSLFRGLGQTRWVKNIVGPNKFVLIIKVGLAFLAFSTVTGFSQTPFGQNSASSPVFFPAFIFVAAIAMLAIYFWRSPPSLPQLSGTWFMGNVSRVFSGLLATQVAMEMSERSSGAALKDLNVIPENELRELFANLGNWSPDNSLEAVLTEIIKLRPFNSWGDLKARVAGIGDGRAKEMKKMGLDISRPKGVSKPRPPSILDLPKKEARWATAHISWVEDAVRMRARLGSSFPEWISDFVIPRLAPALKSTDDLQHIVEIGAGGGGLWTAAAPAIARHLNVSQDKLTGWLHTDVNSAYLNAIPNSKIPRMQFDMEGKWPFEDNSVSAVISLDAIVMASASSLPHVLSELNRVLKPGASALFIQQSFGDLGLEAQRVSAQGNKLLPIVEIDSHGELLLKGMAEIHLPTIQKKLGTPFIHDLVLLKDFWRTGEATSMDGKIGKEFGRQCVTMLKRAERAGAVVAVHSDLIKLQMGRVGDEAKHLGFKLESDGYRDGSYMLRRKELPNFPENWSAFHFVKGFLTHEKVEELNGPDPVRFDLSFYLLHIQKTASPPLVLGRDTGSQGKVSPSEPVLHTRKPAAAMSWGVRTNADGSANKWDTYLGMPILESAAHVGLLIGSYALLRDLSLQPGTIFTWMILIHAVWIVIFPILHGRKVVIQGADRKLEKVLKRSEDHGALMVGANLFGLLSLVFLAIKLFVSPASMISSGPDLWELGWMAWLIEFIGHVIFNKISLLRGGPAAAMGKDGKNDVQSPSSFTREISEKIKQVSQDKENSKSALVLLTNPLSADEEAVRKSLSDLGFSISEYGTREMEREVGGKNQDAILSQLNDTEQLFDVAYIPFPNDGKNHSGMRIMRGFGADAVEEYNGSDIEYFFSRLAPVLFHRLRIGGVVILDHYRWGYRGSIGQLKEMGFQVELKPYGDESHLVFLTHPEVPVWKSEKLELAPYREYSPSAQFDEVFQKVASDKSLDDHDQKRYERGEKKLKMFHRFGGLIPFVWKAGDWTADHATGVGSQRDEARRENRSRGIQRFLQVAPLRYLNTMDYLEMYEDLGMLSGVLDVNHVKSVLDLGAGSLFYAPIFPEVFPNFEYVDGVESGHDFDAFGYFWKPLLGINEKKVKLYKGNAFKLSEIEPLAGRTYDLVLMQKWENKNFNITPNDYVALFHEIANRLNEGGKLILTLKREDIERPTFSQSLIVLLAELQKESFGNWQMARDWGSLSIDEVRSFVFSKEELLAIKKLPEQSPSSWVWHHTKSKFWGTIGLIPEMGILAGVALLGIHIHPLFFLLIPFLARLDAYLKFIAENNSTRGSPLKTFFDPRLNAHFLRTFAIYLLYPICFMLIDSSFIVVPFIIHLVNDFMEMFKGNISLQSPIRFMEVAGTGENVFAGFQWPIRMAMVGGEKSEATVATLHETFKTLPWTFRELPFGTMVSFRDMAPDEQITSMNAAFYNDGKIAAGVWVVPGCKDGACPDYGPEFILTWDPGKKELIVSIEAMHGSPKSQPSIIRIPVEMNPFHSIRERSGEGAKGLKIELDENTFRQLTEKGIFQNESWRKIQEFLPNSGLIWKLVEGSRKQESIFLSTTIFDPDFIEQERALSKKQKTVAIDIMRTLFIQEGSNKGDLRPGVIEQLTTLRDRGVRFVVWTESDRPAVEAKFKKHPELASIFSLAITRENYKYEREKIDPFSPTWRRYIKKVAYAYLQVDQIPSSYVADFYADNPNAKDIKLLGYRVLVDDVRGRQGEFGISPLGRYSLYKVPFSELDPNKNSPELHNFTRDILWICGLAKKRTGPDFAVLPTVPRATLAQVDSWLSKVFANLDDCKNELEALEFLDGKGINSLSVMNLIENGQTHWLPNLDRTPELYSRIGQRLGDYWEKRNWNAANLNAWLGTMALRLNYDKFEQAQWRVNEAIKGDPDDARVGLWALGVTLANHIDVAGLHVEANKAGDFALLDNDVLVSTVRSLIPLLVDWKPSGSLPAPHRGLLEYKPLREVPQADLELNPRQLMLVGLLRMLNPMIYNAQYSRFIDPFTLVPIFHQAGVHDKDGLMVHFLVEMLSNLPEVDQDGVLTGKLLAPNKVKEILEEALSIPAAISSRLNYGTQGQTEHLSPRASSENLETKHTLAQVLRQPEFKFLNINPPAAWRKFVRVDTSGRVNKWDVYLWAPALESLMHLLALLVPVKVIPLLGEGVSSGFVFMGVIVAHIVFVNLISSLHKGEVVFESSNGLRLRTFNKDDISHIRNGFSVFGFPATVLIGIYSFLSPSVPAEYGYVIWIVMGCAYLSELVLHSAFNKWSLSTRKAAATIISSDSLSPWINRKAERREPRDVRERNERTAIAARSLTHHATLRLLDIESHTGSLSYGFTGLISSLEDSEDVKPTIAALVRLNESVRPLRKFDAANQKTIYLQMLQSEKGFILAKAALQKIKEGVEKSYQGANYDEVLSYFQLVLDTAFQPILDILKSRIDFIEGAPSFQSFELGPMLDRISTDPNVDVTNKINPSMRVKGNDLSVSSALLNLVANAVYYSEIDFRHGKVRNRVQLKLDQVGDFARVKIIDRGPGIDSELLQMNPQTGRLSLFDLDSTRRPGGTGLGTTEAWYAIKMAGGRIEVKSELGQGTSFTVWLPLVDQQLLGDHLAAHRFRGLLNEIHPVLVAHENPLRRKSPPKVNFDSHLIYTPHFGRFLSHQFGRKKTLDIWNVRPIEGFRINLIADVMRSNFRARFFGEGLRPIPSDKKKFDLAFLFDSSINTMRDQLSQMMEAVTPEGVLYISGEQRELIEMVSLLSEEGFEVCNLSDFRMGPSRSSKMAHPGVIVASRSFSEKTKREFQEANLPVMGRNQGTLSIQSVGSNVLVDFSFPEMKFDLDRKRVKLEGNLNEAVSVWMDFLSWERKSSPQTFRRRFPSDVTTFPVEIVGHLSDNAYARMILRNGQAHIQLDSHALDLSPPLLALVLNHETHPDEFGALKGDLTYAEQIHSQPKYREAWKGLLEGHRRGAYLNFLNRAPLHSDRLRREVAVAKFILKDLHSRALRMNRMGEVERYQHLIRAMAAALGTTPHRIRASVEKLIERFQANKISRRAFREVFLSMHGSLRTAGHDSPLKKTNPVNDLLKGSPLLLGLGKVPVHQAILRKNREWIQSSGDEAHRRFHSRLIKDYARFFAEGNFSAALKLSTLVDWPTSKTQVTVFSFGQTSEPAPNQFDLLLLEELIKKVKRGRSSHDLVITLHDGADQKDIEMIRTWVGVSFHISVVDLRQTIPGTMKIYSYRSILERKACSKLPSVKAILKGEAEGAEFRTFARVPSAFEIDENLKSVWVILVNLGLGWLSFKPGEIDQTLRQRRMAAQAA